MAEIRTEQIVHTKEQGTATFLEKVTELCREYGLGIEGGFIYYMDPEDHSANYDLAENGEMIRR